MSSNLFFSGNLRRPEISCLQYSCMKQKFSAAALLLKKGTSQFPYSIFILPPADGSRLAEESIPENIPSLFLPDARFTATDFTSDQIPACSSNAGTLDSQPSAMMWMPWQYGLHSLMMRAAISTPVIPALVFSLSARSSSSISCGT